MSDVAAVLTANGESAPPSRIADYIAEDVRIYVNDRMVAQGKPDWLRYASGLPAPTGVFGYSEGWGAEGGSLMIVDQFDTVDRSKLPPNFLADPRHDTRSTLYEFGKDHKIHAIRALIGTGFWIKP